MEAEEHGRAAGSSGRRGRRGPTACAHSCTGCGRASPGRGRRTRSTSTPAARRSRRGCSSSRGPCRASGCSSSRAGPAGPGLAAAPLVDPGGAVVQSDVVGRDDGDRPARAAERGLGNVTGRVLDLEEIDEPDDAYDVVLCREGLMLVPDPARAAREIGRVLRPGGRAVLSVWGPRARNPWLAVVFDVVGAQLGTPMPPPGIPHPFSLDDADRLGGLLTDAGLSHVEVSELPTPYVAASVDEWWERTCALAGPLARSWPRSPTAPHGRSARGPGRRSPSTRHRWGSRSRASRWSRRLAPDRSPSRRGTPATSLDRAGIPSLIESARDPDGVARRGPPSVEGCGAR